MLSVDLIDRLDGTKRANGLHTRSATLKFLIELWKQRNAEMPVATFEEAMAPIEGENVPRVICGRARSGKSFTLRKVLEGCLERGVPFVLVDTVAEHSWIPNTINFGDSMSFKFSGERSCRIVFDALPAVMQEEMKLFFGNLNSLKLDGRLRKYVIAVEESHRFVDTRPVYDFVAEAGKFTLKTIVVSSNPDLWKNVAVPMRPLPKAPAER